jgi:hypothetical protein
VSAALESEPVDQVLWAGRYACVSDLRPFLSLRRRFAMGQAWSEAWRSRPSIVTTGQLIS